MISYLPPKGQYDIHQNFFDNSRGRPYINGDPIYNTQIFHPAILKSSKKIKNGTKSDDTSNNGTTVQPLLNMWVSNEVSYSIINNNNNFNSNNINNNINDNNILTSNESSERWHNNIGIDTNTVITIDLKI